MKKTSEDFSLEVGYLKRSNGSYYYILTPSKAFEEMDSEFLFTAFAAFLKDWGLEFNEDDCLAINIDHFEKDVRLPYVQKAFQFLKRKQTF